MPRSLKSYAGFFCPVSPVSSLFEDPKVPADYKFYTQDQLNSVFDIYPANTYQANLMCAWEFVFGKHYHYGMDEFAKQASSTRKGVLDYLFFPLISRGLAQCDWSLFEYAGEQSFPIMVGLTYLTLAIAAVIIALELIRLVLGIILVIPTLGFIAATRTFNSEPLITTVNNLCDTVINGASNESRDASTLNRDMDDAILRSREVVAALQSEQEKEDTIRLQWK